ncbi:MAG: bifunctional 23S rRNA (guanine(2069)-N(7))-methyltransferase RlmK/23S rRNA (guanine(2445)-N(2))-methyltransferase RlmL [Acidobacteria bacterium]|nr:bifunctional 23S rRNA (guanine(2069)-N(7))-methyltransferase RlmK/23S rRNA (guanine(2445)-N(2))-methyltransferase RlmL [Acidobacteriota bacterium]MCB9398944.1 bifunctional 23S rRNA (guanine(2069)-N(7))-methyltransferase RlmK/23S rRNA (guanine(2445)-N(2))-methyltransferase RlmL [Acidobacteriota bacterium]
MPQYFAVCAQGAESLLADELTQLGALSVKQTQNGVFFKAEWAQVWHVVLWTRLAHRVLYLIHTARAVNRDQLYRANFEIEWPKWLAQDAPIRVFSTLKHCAFQNSLFTSQVVKDGVVDRFKRDTGERPSVGQDGDFVGIHVHIQEDQAQISIELGGNLQKRGYRDHGGPAPIKESLAVLLLLRAGWPETGAFLMDPCCGSGTFLIEGAWMALDRAPGLNLDQRILGYLKVFDADLWQAELQKARDRYALACQKRDEPFLIGRDIDIRAIHATRKHARAAGVDKWMDLAQADLTTDLTRPAASRVVVVTNPPYGSRMGEKPENLALYAQLGRGLAGWSGGWRMGLLTEDAGLAQATRLRAARKWKVMNGPLECQFFLFESKPDSNETAATPAATHTAEKNLALEAFCNRLRKNEKVRRKWAQKHQLEAYRIYDADLPDYNVAIDRYGPYVVVAEYQAPAEMDAAKTQRRLNDVLLHAPDLLAVEASQVVLKTRKRQRGRDQYERVAARNERLQVQEGSARFWVNLWDFLDTGLFLDSRGARQWLAERASGRALLNLFCYTGTATVVPALAGLARSVSVDLSRTYLDWAQDNFTLNGLNRNHVLLRDDVLQYLDAETEKFDLIYLDPPTFSNSKSMSDTLDIQRDHPNLIDLCLKRLKPGGSLLFLTNFTKFKWAWPEREPYRVEELTQKLVPEDFKRQPKSCAFAIHHRV